MFAEHDYGFGGLVVSDIWMLAERIGRQRPKRIDIRFFYGHEILQSVILLLIAPIDFQKLFLAGVTSKTFSILYYF